MTTPNVIPMKEVRRHRSPESVWFVIHDVVYDVTTFLEQHPGGAEALLENAGQDSTNAFEDVGHSEAARQDLKKYKIGDLHPDDRLKKLNLTNNIIKFGTAALVVGILVGFVLKRYHVI